MRARNIVIAFSYCVNSFALLVFWCFGDSGVGLGLGYVWAAEVRNIYSLFVALPCILLYPLLMTTICECDYGELSEVLATYPEYLGVEIEKEIIGR